MLRFLFGARNGGSTNKRPYGIQNFRCILAFVDFSCIQDFIGLHIA